MLYSDADWGNCVDTRKSISGYVSKLSSGAVTWSSKKQPTVAKSTMEAEYLALAAATGEVVWICSLFKNLDQHWRNPC
jgi:hypothetical protein